MLVYATCLSNVFAETAEDIKSRINDRNNAIDKLEKEIKQYQNEIEEIGKEKDSLNKTIKSLDISKKKLQTDTKVTENKIASKNLEIRELSLQIGDKNERIYNSKTVISQSLYNIYKMDSMGIVEAMLGKKSLSDIWNNADELAILQGSMQDRIDDLVELKTDLEENKKQTEKKKTELVSLTNDLKNQTKIVADTVKEKSNILSETKNTEANYKKLLIAKQLQKEEFERELMDFESALKTVVNLGNIPTTGSGVLKWPLENVKITQYFGNTKFAAEVRGGTHNGIDLGTPIGTPIKSALSGVIMGSGNMDLANAGRCRSYGKWILVKHYNGLSTLYAHLSLIKAEIGQEVITGEIIGYSGITGYATGPHLHFTVFASEGVTIQKLTNGVKCKNAVIPVAPRNAYLNPLSYL